MVVTPSKHIQGYSQAEASGVPDPAEAEIPTSVQTHSCSAQGPPIQRSGCHSIPLPAWTQDHSTKLPHHTSPSASA